MESSAEKVMFRVSMTAKEFVEKFKNWDEATSTFPSGMNLSHHHAMTKPHGVSEKDDKHAEIEQKRMELTKAHAALTNCAAKFGHTHKRWKNIATSCH